MSDAINTLDDLRAGKLKGATRLNLQLSLHEFPSTIFDLADSLEVLNLNDNQLRDLPEDLARLKKLKILFLTNNKFEEVPKCISECSNLTMLSFKGNGLKRVPEGCLPKSLRWLILTDNAISELPSSMGSLSALQKLALAGNELEMLPEEMAACHNLELIRIAANRLKSLPTWLVELPRLAWLGYAGNPFCNAVPAASSVVQEIEWSEVQVEEKLSESAASIVHAGKWKDVSVVIKIYKGDIISDGSPDDEIRAWLATGKHPNIVEVQGLLVDHPSKRKGVVFSRAALDYKVLANVPSFESCSRDTYPLGAEFSLPFIRNAIFGVASACVHLHARGILHGDLYGHNILCNKVGKSVVGDLGAASIYDLADHTLAVMLERIEVRAFGYLVEELLDRCSAESERNETILGLRRLQQSCLNLVPSKRLTFGQIAEHLAN